MREEKQLVHVRLPIVMIEDLDSKYSKQGFSNRTEFIRNLLFNGLKELDGG